MQTRGRRSAIRARTSASQALGSTLLRRQVVIIVSMTAARSAPRCEPAKVQLQRPRAMPRRDLSAALLERQMRASASPLWKSGSPMRLASARRTRMARPVCKRFLQERLIDQSASTYPASETCSQPRWRYARSGPHKIIGVQRRVFLQDSDCCSTVTVRPSCRPLSQTYSIILASGSVDQLRRDNLDEVRQEKLASSSRWKSGPGKG